VERQQLEEICKICLLRRAGAGAGVGVGVLESEGGEGGEEDLEASSLFISTKYDLVANICHDSIVSQGVSIVSEAKTKTKGSSSGSGSGRGESNDSTNVLQNGIYRIHVQNKVRDLAISWPYLGPTVATTVCVLTK
jgi:hypothetical protein